MIERDQSWAIGVRFWIKNMGRLAEYLVTGRLRSIEVGVRSIKLCDAKKRRAFSKFDMVNLD